MKKNAEIHIMSVEKIKLSVIDFHPPPVYDIYIYIYIYIYILYIYINIYIHTHYKY